MRAFSVLSAVTLTLVPLLGLAPTASATGPWICPVPAVGAGIEVDLLGVSVGACLTPCAGIGGHVEVIHEGIITPFEPQTGKVCIKNYRCQWPADYAIGRGVWVELNDVPIAGVKVCLEPCPLPSLGVKVQVGFYVDPLYPSPIDAQVCTSPTDCTTYGPGYIGTGQSPVDVCVDPTACLPGLGFGVNGITVCVYPTDCTTAYGPTYVGTGLSGTDACIQPDPACPPSTAGPALGVRINNQPPICVP